MLDNIDHMPLNYLKIAFFGMKKSMFFYLLRSVMVNVIT